MEFKRKKKRGINQKFRRFWLSATGYRIIWRRKVFGVNVKPAFQACVRVIVPGNDDNTEMWDFVEHDKRLYRTMNAAVTACEQHRKLWSRATECTGIRAIQELFGRRPTSVPKWVAGKLNRHVSVILLDSTSGRRGDAVLGPNETEEPAKKPAKKPVRKSVKKQKSKKGAKK